MKKLLLLVCAAVMSLSASAQAGDKAVGAQLVFGSETNSFGLGVKGQYYFTDQLRGEASVDYFFKNKGVIKSFHKWILFYIIAFTLMMRDISYSVLSLIDHNGKQ